MRKQKNRIPWNKGKKLSEEHIEKLKESHRTESYKKRFSGKNRWNWIGGKPKCLLCGKEISYTNKYCKKCSGILRKGKYIKSLISHSEIIELYKKGNPTTKLSKIAGISTVAIFGILKRNNVLIRTKKESEFLKRKYDYESIINDYKNGMFLRDVANKYNIGASYAFHILKNNGIKSRGREGICKGSLHPMWKGGKTHDIDGYVIQKEGRTHRIEIEKLIGRKLYHWESVHHVNGDKKNYEINNLVIMPGKEHIRFHTFLRQANINNINRENLEKFCRKESDLSYRFIKKDYEKACNLIGHKLSALYIRKRIKKKCCIKNCDIISYTTKNFCSKHYQRFMAKKRGYWRSGGNRKCNFLGKFSKEKIGKNY